MQERVAKRQEIKDILTRNRCAFDEIFGCGGESVLLLARGARVIGMFPNNDTDANNVLWVNPAIERLLTGKLEDWVEGGMGSVGGDRLWVSPERNYYYKKPQTFTGWFCPREMDPGSYQRQHCGGQSVTYENKTPLTHYGTGALHSDVRMSRSFVPLSTASLGVAVEKSIASVGVRTVESLRVPENAPDIEIQPWVLTQIPVGTAEKPGTVIVPVRKGAEPIGYFGTIPSDRLHQSADHVSFRIDALSIFKLGVKPEDVPSGRPTEIAYFLHLESNGQAMLLLRRTHDAPVSQKECYDASKADPEGVRGAIQAYNHGPTNGADYPYFGEMEIQLRPLRREPDGWYAQAVTDLWAFQGARQTVLDLIPKLLKLGGEAFLF